MVCLAMEVSNKNVQHVEVGPCPIARRGTTFTTVLNSELADTRRAILNLSRAILRELNILTITIHSRVQDGHYISNPSPPRGVASSQVRRTSPRLRARELAETYSVTQRHNAGLLPLYSSRFSLQSPGFGISSRQNCLRSCKTRITTTAITSYRCFTSARTRPGSSYVGSSSSYDSELHI